jgi:hypothetical protein
MPLIDTVKEKAVDALEYMQNQGIIFLGLT